MADHALTPKSEREVIYLLVSPQLKRLLNQAAKENQRSLTGECVVRLHRSIKAEQGRPAEYRQP